MFKILVVLLLCLTHFQAHSGQPISEILKNEEDAQGREQAQEREELEKTIHTFLQGDSLPTEGHVNDIKEILRGREHLGRDAAEIIVESYYHADSTKYKNRALYLIEQLMAFTRTYFPNTGWQTVYDVALPFLGSEVQLLVGNFRGQRKGLVMAILTSRPRPNNVWEQKETVDWALQALITLLSTTTKDYLDHLSYDFVALERLSGKYELDLRAQTDLQDARPTQWDRLSVASTLVYLASEADLHANLELAAWSFGAEYGEKAVVPIHTIQLRTILEIQRAMERTGLSYELIKSELTEAIFDSSKNNMLLVSEKFDRTEIKLIDSYSRKILVERSRLDRSMFQSAYRHFDIIRW